METILLTIQHDTAQYYEDYKIVLTAVITSILSFGFGLLTFWLKEYRKDRKEFYSKNRGFIEGDLYQEMKYFNDSPPLFMKKEAKILKGYANVRIGNTRGYNSSGSDKECSHKDKSICFCEEHVRSILRMN